ncbi:MAG: hypothetical protein MUP45_01185 [Candidatus Marinimicrobia bacterium]|nr:hypothetical protein [Candidatus Neomarinimicrobiota bacterium]
MVVTYLAIPWKEPTPHVYPIVIPTGAQKLELEEIDSESFANLELSPVYFSVDQDGFMIKVEFYGIQGDKLYHAADSHHWYEAYVATGYDLQGSSLTVYLERSFEEFIGLMLFNIFISGALACVLVFPLIVWDIEKEKRQTEKP